MPLTYVTTDYAAGGTVVAADIVSRFDEIKTKFNAGIVNGDISTTAAISVDKLDANIEHLLVNFMIHGPYQTTAPLWPAAGTIMQLIQIPNDGKGNWTISAGELACSDVGNDAAEVRFEWGRYSANVWTVTSTPVTAVAINSDDSIADTAGQQTLAIAAGTLTAGTHRGLAMVVAVQGANTLSAVTDYISASFLLYRKIANG